MILPTPHPKPGAAAVSTSRALAPLPALGPVLDFMRLMWAVDHGLQSTSKRMSGTLGVTGPQRLVIRIVGCVPGISAGRLAQVLHVHPSTITGVVDRLERAKLLRRQPDPSDGRRALLSLTPRGRAIDTDVHGTVEFAVRRALTRLSPEQIGAAREMLEAIALSLESVAP